MYAVSFFATILGLAGFEQEVRRRESVSLYREHRESAQRVELLSTLGRRSAVLAALDRNVGVRCRSC